MVKRLTKLIKWLIKRKSYPETKKLNIENIYNYIISEYRSIASTSKLLNVPKYIHEQAIYRMGEVKKRSPECFRKDECKYCGCTVSEEVFGNKGCEYPPKCYTRMLSEKEWNLFKKVNNIKIEL